MKRKTIEKTRKCYKIEQKDKIYDACLLSCYTLLHFQKSKSYKSFSLLVWCHCCGHMKALTNIVYIKYINDIWHILYRATWSTALHLTNLPASPVWTICTTLMWTCWNGVTVLIAMWPLVESQHRCLWVLIVLKWSEQCLSDQTKHAGWSTMLAPVYVTVCMSDTMETVCSVM